MVGARTLTAIIGILGSLALSVALWWLFDTLVFFLVVPFVPLLFNRATREQSERVCPTCGFRTTASEYTYCPRDGSRLED